MHNMQEINYIGLVIANHYNCNQVYVFLNDNCILNIISIFERIISKKKIKLKKSVFGQLIFGRSYFPENSGK